MNIMSHTKNSCVWHAVMLTCVQCIRNGQLVFLTFYFINDLSMNSFESSLNIRTHTQASLHVKFTCNLYSLFSHISSKYFKVY